MFFRINSLFVNFLFFNLFNYSVNCSVNLNQTQFLDKTNQEEKIYIEVFENFQEWSNHEYENETFLMPQISNFSITKDDDFSKFKDLEIFSLFNWYSQPYKIISINFINNKKLKEILIVNNQLKEIILPFSKSLTELDLSENELTDLYVENNFNLNKINLEKNQLQEINLVYNTNLEILNLKDNKPNLKIKLNEKYKNNSINIFLYDYDAIISYEAIELRTWLNKHDENTTELICSNCYLEGSSNLSNFKKLKKLNLQNNKIKFLYLDENLDLEELNLSFNLLKNIKLINNLKLISLNLSHNQLDNVDFSQQNHLKKIVISYNRIKNINVKNCNQLEIFLFSYNKVKKINLKLNLKLRYLFFKHNQFKEIDLKNLNKLIKFNSKYNEKDLKIKLNEKYKNNSIKIFLHDYDAVVTYEESSLK